MALSINVADLPTDNASFDDYFASFSVSRQTDGEGGVVYMGTMSVMVKDSLGNPYKSASLSRPLGTAAKVALRDFLKAQFLTELKVQEGL